MKREIVIDKVNNKIKINNLITKHKEERKLQEIIQMKMKMFYSLHHINTLLINEYKKN